MTKIELLERYLTEATHDYTILSHEENEFRLVVRYEEFTTGPYWPADELSVINTENGGIAVMNKNYEVLATCTGKMYTNFKVPQPITDTEQLYNAAIECIEICKNMLDNRLNRFVVDDFDSMIELIKEDKKRSVRRDGNDERPQ